MKKALIIILFTFVLTQIQYEPYPIANEDEIELREDDFPNEEEIPNCGNKEVYNHRTN
jgi:hypothetical protein